MSDERAGFDLAKFYDEPDWSGLAPFVGIPTTAGTGSEVTRVMVISDTDRDVKMMFASRYCLAVAAIVDPLLTVAMPKRLTARGG